MAAEIPIACSLPDAELRKREATLLAQFKSAAMRQKASTQAVSAAGVSSAAVASAIRWFFPRFLLTLGPWPNRILTTMTIGYQSNSFLR